MRGWWQNCHHTIEKQSLWKYSVMFRRKVPIAGAKKILPVSVLLKPGRPFSSLAKVENGVFIRYVSSPTMVLNFPVGTARFPHSSLDIFTMATKEEGYQIKLSEFKRLTLLLHLVWPTRLYALVRKDLISTKLYNKSGFLVIHKIDNIGIFVQLLMDINWK